MKKFMIAGLLVCGLSAVVWATASTIQRDADGAEHYQQQSLCYDEVAWFYWVTTGNSYDYYKITCKLKRDGILIFGMGVAGPYEETYHQQDILPNTTIGVYHIKTTTLTNHTCSETPSYTREIMVWAKPNGGEYAPESGVSDSDTIPHDDPY